MVKLLMVKNTGLILKLKINQLLSISCLMKEDIRTTLQRIMSIQFVLFVIGENFKILDMNKELSIQDRISILQQKYPNGISDVSALSEEQKAWLQITIQAISNCKEFKLVSNLQRIHNRLIHSLEDIPDKELQEMASYIFYNIDEIKAYKKG